MGSSAAVIGVDKRTKHLTSTRERQGADSSSTPPRAGQSASSVGRVPSPHARMHFSAMKGVCRLFLLPRARTKKESTGARRVVLDDPRLDHVLVLSEAHLRRVLRECVAYFSTARPHQSPEQRAPEAGTALRLLRPEPGRTMRPVPLLGGLHRTCQRAA